MTIQRLGEQIIGAGKPVYIVAEIGINHNGDIEIAKKMIEFAHKAGCDAVKFQKRTPKLSTPSDQLKIMRETPWGYISYLEYREKIEFGQQEYREIDRYCKKIGIPWFASVWDELSVDFIKKFNPTCYKIPSAMITNVTLLRHVKKTGKPVILSTGMSTMIQIQNAVKIIGAKNLILTHCTSIYPCPPEELNLKMIKTLMKKYKCPIGYSGHETGLATTVAAVALGACYVERHITLDRAMWGTDQAASVEPTGFNRLVKDIRTVEKAIGDGVKKVYKSELFQLRRLRH